ncbi:MAG: hypothetical protein A2Z04_05815 [Chloroflexi bacterium RBG_16_57_9]|nr:MAG: hypothetical protein A2Z04_05815 [Chloroflexi bacterium RBG_16_57_9]
MLRSLFLILSLLVLLYVGLAGMAQAGDVVFPSLYMSASPGGSQLNDFPANTRNIYANFSYRDMRDELITLQVLNRRGHEYFKEDLTITGTGQISVSVTRQGQTFEVGLYNTILRYAGQSETVVWTIGGVDAPIPTALPPASLRVQPPQVELTAFQGALNPSPRGVFITNQGEGLLLWRAAVDTSWLRINPASSGAPSVMRIGANTTGLPGASYPGALYWGRIAIDAQSGALNSPQVVDVALKVIAPDSTELAEIRPITRTLGWVSSNEPAGNHFGGPDIRAGTLGSSRFLGVAQFSLPKVPTDTAIYAAALELTGREVISSTTTGQWVVHLVESNQNEVWATRTYTDVATAHVLATLAPSTGSADLRPGLRNFYHLEPDQLHRMQDQMTKGIVTFVIEGIGQGGDSLFAWHTGNAPETSLQAPLLRINYGLPTPTPTITPTMTSTPTSTPVVSTSSGAQ